MTNEEIGDAYRRFQLNERTAPYSIYAFRQWLIGKMGDQAPTMQQVTVAVAERIKRDNEIYLKQLKSKR